MENKDKEELELVIVETPKEENNVVIWVDPELIDTLLNDLWQTDAEEN